MRNPIEVAKSLQLRNGMNFEGALRLWSLYTAAAIRNTDGQPRFFTCYESYFSNFDSELGRLATFMEKKRPRPGSETYRRISTSLDSGLRHQQASVIELFEQQSLGFSEKGLYALLQQTSVSGPKEWTHNERNRALEDIAISYCEHQQMLGDLDNTLAELQKVHFLPSSLLGQNFFPHLQQGDGYPFHP